MGRPRKSKADKIRELLGKGKTVAEVIKTTGATPSYVYAVKSKMREAVKPNQTGSTGIAAAKRTGNEETGIATLTPKTTPPAAKPIEPQPTLWQRIKRVFGWQ